ncbi:hypothetical protein MSG28_009158 [Choristoneura fumiferana]|uniref:Uncharacterized protein n=1 Tax=Choristoneura fumiferana TaxID=7141 RepID=A0ACC0KX31_CHOFU|nr:hypothetical protein MSG28_009158 [Choristoneura fumiferana]
MSSAWRGKRACGSPDGKQSPPPMDTYQHEGYIRCVAGPVVGPCARPAQLATTILLANPAVKQQCLHCCVSAWRSTDYDVVAGKACRRVAANLTNKSNDGGHYGTCFFRGQVTIKLLDFEGKLEGNCFVHPQPFELMAALMPESLTVTSCWLQYEWAGSTGAVTKPRDADLAFIMSAERRPLLDIGLPQGSPLRPVLCFPHPPRSRGLNQAVAPSCWRPTDSSSPGLMANGVRRFSNVVRGAGDEPSKTAKWESDSRTEGFYQFVEGENEQPDRRQSPPPMDTCQHEGYHRLLDVKKTHGFNFKRQRKLEIVI